MKHKWSRVIVVAVLLMLGYCGTTSAQIWYVDAAKPAGGDGTSWATAFKTIQSAISAANPAWVICLAPTDQIWVKQGTYTLTAELSLGKTVTMYGGFPSSVASPTLSQRKPSVYTTTINGNDTVRCMTITSFNVIDGFTFTRGYTTVNGAALTIDGVSGISCSPSPTLMVTIRNCKFTDNFAGVHGGAVYIQNSSARFENCSFSLNSADAGGAVKHWQSYPYFDQCSFYQNESTASGSWGGGAICGDYYSYGTITNCLFYQNVSASWGGAIGYHLCYPVIKNCTFADNESVYNGGAIYTNTAEPTLTNCILWDDTPNEIFNEFSDPATMTYTDIEGGYTGTGNINLNPQFVGSGDYHLTLSSPCVDQGTNTGAPTVDIEGSSRPIDGNNDASAITDMGAYEFSYVDLTVQSVTISPAIPQVGQPITVSVTVRNQGYVDVGAFWIDWYANQPDPPGVGEFGQVYQYFAGLAAGAAVTMTKTYTYTATGTFSMYAQVDSTGSIAESNENNNVYYPGTVRVIDGTLLDFNIQPEAYNATKWFGGDDGTTKRNVGVGQSMITTRDAHVTKAGFRFTKEFDYANNPDGAGHAVTLILDIRDASGTILKTVSRSVPSSFAGGWVDFSLGNNFWMEANTTYIFTCYLYKGEYNELYNSVCGRSTDPWPTLTGYSATVASLPANMKLWANWSTHPWDFNLHLAGQYVEPYPGDINNDRSVNIIDLRQFAENWLTSDCIMPDWCQNSDINWSGVVRLEDFNIISRYWLKTYFDYEDLNRAAIASMSRQMSSASISGSKGSEFKAGTYFVYQTSAGRYGKFIVENWDTTTHALTIGWTTYNASGTLYSTGTGLVIHGTFHCDLDIGSETNLNSDFWWEQTSSTERYLNPENGALFKLIYRAP